MRVLKKIDMASIDKEANLFINNIPESWYEKDLEEIIKKQAPGAVIQSSIIMRDENEKSYKFGYVQLETKDNAEEVIRSLNGYKIEEYGNILIVSRYLQKRIKTPSINYCCLFQRLPTIN